MATYTGVLEQLHDIHMDLDTMNKILRALDFHLDELVKHLKYEAKEARGI